MSVWITESLLPRSRTINRSKASWKNSSTITGRSWVSSHQVGCCSSSRKTLCDHRTALQRSTRPVSSVVEHRPDASDAEVRFLDGASWGHRPMGGRRHRKAEIRVRLPVIPHRGEARGPTDPESTCNFGRCPVPTGALSLRKEVRVQIRHREPCPRRRSR